MKRGKPQRRYVRQMPKIYGNLQKPARSYQGLARFFSGLFWLGAFLSLCYAFFFSGWFAIHRVEVDGAHFSSASQIAQLVPKGSSIWLLSEDQLRNHILKDSRIQSVSIFRGLPDSLRIVVVEKQPSLLWISGDTTTVLDEDGEAFMQYSAANFPTSTSQLGQYLATLPKVRDTKALPVSLNQPVASPIFINFLSQVQTQLKSDLPEFSLDHIEIADTTYDVTFVAKQGMQVQFNSLGDAGVQVRNLTRLVHQKKATLASRVDLRIDRWAYVE